MKHTKEEMKNTADLGEKETQTCVCNMEWRGSHEDAWGDCVCYPDEQKKGEE